MNKVQINDDKTFEEENYFYNNAVSDILYDFIFSAERVEIKYINIKEFDDKEFIYNPVIVDEENKNRIIKDYDKPFVNGYEQNEYYLDYYEKIIISQLINSHKTNIFLAGALGSGKTATIDHIKKFLENQEEHVRPIVLFINFNENYNRSDSKQEILYQFRSRFCMQLFVKLDQLFKDDIRLFEEVLSEINENIGIEYCCFYKIKSSIDIKSNEYCSETARKVLLNFIEEEKNLKLRLYCYMYLLKSIRITQIRNNKKILMLFDNIDQLEPKCQYLILDEVISSNEIAKIKSLIALRRCTFNRLLGRGAFDYGVIPHKGPLPVKIITHRINYYLDNFEIINDNYALSKHFKESLRKRLKQVLYILTDKNEKRSQSLINGLFGRSIRLALTVIPKLIINDVLPFDKDANIKNSLIRAIIKPCTNAASRHKDHTINIFKRSGDEKLTLLPLIILSIVRNAHLENKCPVTTKYMVSKLNLFQHFSENEIVDSFNLLFDITAPFIWINSNISIKTIDDLIEDNDHIFMTELGSSYYEIVIEHLTYIQESLFDIRFESERMPVTIDNTFISRFMVTLQFLHEIIDEEVRIVKSTMIFDKENFPVRWHSIAKKLVLTSSEAFVKILNYKTKNMQDDVLNDFDLNNLLFDWKDLLTKAYNIELFKLSSIDINANIQINNLINQVDNALN